MTGSSGITLDPLGDSDLPELRSLFAGLNLHMPEENVEQFSRPRRPAPGIEVVTIGLRENGRLVGTVGWLELPVRLRGGGRTSSRWLVNFYMSPELRGRGLGRRLEAAAREGSALCVITGGTAHSIPLFEKAGWRLAGEVATWRWTSPCLSPGRAAGRLLTLPRRPPPGAIDFRWGSGTGSLISARVGMIAPGATPWAESDDPAGPPEHGVPRNAEYLAFAFSGAMRNGILTYSVASDGAPVGFFALAVRSLPRPLLGVDILDFDAVPGREHAVLAAARRTALACADVARLRVTRSPRFARALADLGARPSPGPGVPLRLVASGGVSGRPMEALLDAEAWRITPGDHDQYRTRPGFQPWAGVRLNTEPQRR